MERNPSQIIDLPLTQSDFISILTEAQFDVNKYQRTLVITIEDDIPFQ
jgi:predicted transcriptional regulator